MRQSAKVKPEQVTVPQWISANMRILKSLMERGDISSMGDVLDYMQYTEEIGEYFQIYSTPSVMLFDHRYRERQSKEKFRWATPDFHGVNFFLRPTNRPSLGNNKSVVSVHIPKDSKGQNICRDYQTESGCRRRFCKFSHVFTSEGCRQNHPKYLHKLITKGNSAISQ
ncbi:hypothetical protein LOTGIDRAFT_157539 [Lottia gigantea]|uniref:C3H1-type domain-containing protein n=1 Tax=Lottia gigantea TaxID=225164 RepID=V4AVK7_LOTGI|nr:hypothetical protein LOTGIDRAFT_157539 [Lottia gigantea]ESP01363.1 hypothetical protein LOTGIDRAFT_157539 [Lottia gigantea]